MVGKRSNEMQVADLHLWIEDDMLYIQTKDGRVSILDPKQANRLGNDLIALAKDGGPVTVDLAKYGRIK